MQKSDDWKKISINPYGYVFEKKNIIIKIVPEPLKKEILFWKKIILSDYEKKLFVIPDQTIKKSFHSKKNLFSLNKGDYYFIYMPKRGKTLESSIAKTGLTLDSEKKIVHDIFKILKIIQRQEFIHADVHFQNILLYKNRFYLIDYGLVMHRDFCKTKYEEDLHKLYLWSRDDNFTLISRLYFYQNDKKLIKNNDYLPIRKKWIIFFSTHPNDWCTIKKTLENLFDFKNKEDFFYCFQFYIQNILSNSSKLSPKPGIQIYDMLIKIFLDRTFLIVSIYFPKIIRLNVKKSRTHFYKSLISECFINHK